MGADKKTTLRCAVSESTAEKLKAIAEKTGESVGDVVDFIVTEYAKGQEGGDN